MGVISVFYRLALAEKKDAQGSILIQNEKGDFKEIFEEVAIASHFLIVNLHHFEFRMGIQWRRTTTKIKKLLRSLGYSSFLILVLIIKRAIDYFSAIPDASDPEDV